MDEVEVWLSLSSGRARRVISDKHGSCYSIGDVGPQSVYDGTEQSDSGATTADMSGSLPTL